MLQQSNESRMLQQSYESQMQQQSYESRTQQQSNESRQSHQYLLVTRMYRHCYESRMQQGPYKSRTQQQLTYKHWWMLCLLVTCLYALALLGFFPEVHSMPREKEARCVTVPHHLYIYTLRASLSGTFLHTLPDSVTPLKGHSLSPRSCPATRSALSERFEY